MKVVIFDIDFHYVLIHEPVVDRYRKRIFYRGQDSLPLSLLCVKESLPQDLRQYAAVKEARLVLWI